MSRVTFRRSSNNLIVLAVGVFAVGTDGFVLNGLLPTIARDLHVSVSTAGQLTTVFAATYAIASPVIATVTGSWDRRWVLGGRMSVLVRPTIAKTLAVTAVSVLASFSVLVYLPVVAAPSVHGAMISWVLLAFGSGQVVGNWLAGRWTDRFGPGRVRLVGLGGAMVVLAVIGAAAQSLPTMLLVAVCSGGLFGLTFVPQQHRLFTLAPDRPTVA